MLKIIRVERDLQCTRGVMLINNMASFVTLENPWRDNQPNISCIPAGRYLINPFSSPKFGQTFEVLKVPGRSGILCPHVGNAASDTQGCVLLAMFFSVFEGERSISSSKVAIDAFRKMMPTLEAMTLEIVDV